MTIPRIDPRVQPTVLHISETPEPGRVSFRMEVEATFTDSLNRGYKATYTMKLPTKVVEEDLSKDLATRHLQLRKSHGWKRETFEPVGWSL